MQKCKSTKNLYISEMRKGCARKRRMAHAFTRAPSSPHSPDVPFFN